MLVRGTDHDWYLLTMLSYALGEFVNAAVFQNQSVAQSVHIDLIRLYVANRIGCDLAEGVTKPTDRTG